MDMQNILPQDMNHAYIFIPICIMREDCSFFELREMFLRSGCWASVTDEILYIYRYITDKMNPENSESCLFFHMAVSDKALSDKGLGASGDIYSICPKDEYKYDDKICFKISGIHLYWFKTLVGVAAIQLSFESSDPLSVATGLYYLKKPKREHIWCRGKDTERSLFDIASEIINGSVSVGISYFFHLNDGMERSNTMSLTYHQPDADIDREIFYLKNCYRKYGFEYTTEQHREDESLVTSDDYVWGITEENLACVITRHTKHIDNGFIKHFSSQYLFMYVLLLHRKYDLYRMLTDIGVGAQRDLSSLKHYREILYEYQNDYSFERITEVPQYHRLYKYLEKKMDLDALFADVMEPISSLSELRQEKAEEELSKKNGEIEKALGLLSILTVFSALIDCYSYIEVIRADLMNFKNISPMSYIHLLFSLIIVGTVVFVIRKIKK